MIFEVVMYDDGDEPVATALVEADDSRAAHAMAMRLMRKKYPELDPEKYNQTLVMEKLFRGSTP